MSGSSNHGFNGIPGANAMGDTLEFVKNLWGSMKIPGMAVPSMSPEEIDKQIADLKAVESWLQMNMNMLRGSIQALEVQSATLSALRAMSESFSQAASGKSAADDKPPFESPFSASGFTSPFASAFSTASAADEAAEKDKAPAQEAAEPTGMAGMIADAAQMAAPFANPATWWNAVQDQFQQVVSQAVAPPAKPARKTATAKKKAATANKKSAATSSAASSRRRTRKT